ncbi:hypothetical protein QFC22_000116 [Naganishia vaughanmartiniae]|uniref:Uncharacterized protein n=1 Tax=Naganishia vaughanmartiniae TaxID=1424756 RepID=A0ACC2XR36_9TREE|nr:hypothetical protein QFC22_000116 [Naganishia vaughanmartiniae]
MSHSGSKRTREDDADHWRSRKDGLDYGGEVGDHSASAAKRPRDWREAFLDEGDRPHRRYSSFSPIKSPHQLIPRYSHVSDRHHSDDRDRRHRDYRPKEDGKLGHDSRYESERNRRSSHGRHSRDDDHRRHRDARQDNDRHGERNSQRGRDQEEGEIESPKRAKSRSASPPIPPHKRGPHEIRVPRGPSSSLRDLPRVSQTMPSDISKSTDVLALQQPLEGEPAQQQPTDKNVEEANASESALVNEEPADLEALLEERRRKRRELLERLAGTQSGVTSAAPSSVEGITSVQSNGTTADIRASAAKLGLSATSSGISTQAKPRGPTEEVFELGKATGISGLEAETLPVELRAQTLDGEVQISAADYNPDDDRKLDDQRRKDHDTNVGTEQPQTAASRKDIADGVGEPKPAVAVEEDEYEEVEEDVDNDDFDMFAVDDAPKKKRKVLRKKSQPVKTLAVPAPVAATLVDNYDDSEGYYRITPGEVLDDGRYQITVNLGKGMFAQVMRAKILKASQPGEKVGQEVAIKVIRSQESMYIAGRKEAQILSKLVAADPDDKKHIVRLFRTFEHRGHFCLVTESLSMNLRDVIKRFGKDVGLNLRAVRAYAHQIFLALSLMKKCNVIHADLKPDNILAILGLPYDDSLDMWSIGCTLYELYTGKILFPGKSNNHMLHLMMDLKGKFNHRMIKKAQFGPMHFDEGMNFDVSKTIVINKATRDLKSRLMPPSSVQMRMKDEDLKLLTSFVDLLDKTLMLDPAKRISSKEALLHPFLTG